MYIDFKIGKAVPYIVPLPFLLMETKMVPNYIIHTTHGDLICNFEFTVYDTSILLFPQPNKEPSFTAGKDEEQIFISCEWL